MARDAVSPYGVAIQQARASGDLEQMRQAAAEAEDHLATYGDVAGKLRELKSEIARLEAAGAK